MNTLLFEQTKVCPEPANFLNEWIQKGTLVSLIMDAAQTLDWPETDLRLDARSGYAFRRLARLTMVTYCYAVGIYGPRDIALRVSRDEILGFLCSGTSPTWKDIRDFASRNRDLIRQALLQTYKRARAYGLRDGIVGPTNGQRCDAGDDHARVDRDLQLAEAAELQVESPAFVDALAMPAR